MDPNQSAAARYGCSDPLTHGHFDSVYSAEIRATRAERFQWLRMRAWTPDGAHMMITHLVLMNLNDPADAAFVSTTVRSLEGSVPGLRLVRGGPTVIRGDRSWDLGFLMIFDSADAVESYQSHPEHVAVAEAIRDLLRDMGTCDLETEEPAHS